MDPWALILQVFWLYKTTAHSFASLRAWQQTTRPEAIWWCTTGCSNSSWSNMMMYDMVFQLVLKQYDDVDRVFQLVLKQYDDVGQGVPTCPEAIWWCRQGVPTRPEAIWWCIQGVPTCPEAIWWCTTRCSNSSWSNMMMYDRVLHKTYQHDRRF